MTRYQNHIRLFTEAPLQEGGNLTLTQEQSHYLANVMRLKEGAQLALFNGRDGEWLAALSQVAKRSVSVTVDKQLKVQQNEPDLWLVFAPIKKARIDFIAQKATELGVSHLQPVYTERTIVSRVKTDRLQANAIEAAEQCERLNVPTIAEPAKLSDILLSWPENRQIMFCDEDLSGTPAHDSLRNMGSKTAPGPWAILIGPEGGFTDQERALIKAMPQTTTVSLGPRVLRADTAAMAAITLWQSALGDW